MTQKARAVKCPRISKPLFLNSDVEDSSAYSRLKKVLIPQAPPTLREGTTEIKKAEIKDIDPSNQEVDMLVEGLVHRPFDYSHVPDYFSTSPQHSTCILTKKVCTVGLGLVGQKPEPRLIDPEQLMLGQDGPDADKETQSATEKALNDLCSISFLDVMSDVAEDYWEYGQGYMEIVRRDGRITGIYHLSAADVWVYLEDTEGRNYHFVVQSLGQAGGGIFEGRRFARWGDKDDFIARWGSELNPDKVSEVICFRQASNKSKWYGFPGYLSAVPRIELSCAVAQFQHDFFWNRGVPEFMLFVLGATLSDQDWEEIEESLKAATGIGRSHKSVGFNLGNPEIRVQVERLALDQAADPTQFSKTAETYALEIVSAHQVPPLLAGIMIPGKLGAANEMTNSILGFQTLVIGPAQKSIETTLKVTLGTEPGFSEEDFSFHTITESMKAMQSQPGFKEAETMARMRTPVAGGVSPQGGNGTGRNLSEGLRR